LFTNLQKSESASRKRSSASRNDHAGNTEKKVKVQEKKCCTLEEIYDRILAGKDISKMKVCAYRLSVILIM
jgi:hypothetical protein